MSTVGRVVPAPSGVVRPGVVSVARAAGVSPATVSNTFNRPDRVSSVLRDRVLRAADELGYGGGDPSARILRGRRASALGIVLRERLAYAFDDPALVAVLQGISESTDREQLALVIIPAYPETGNVDGPAVRHAAVDGLILYSLAGDDPLVAAARRRHLPTVVIDSPHGADADGLGPHGFVGIDERAAGDAAVSHLLELGHRRIGFVSSRLSATGVPGLAALHLVESSTASVATGRLGGARDAMTRAGVAWDDVPVVQCRTSSVADGERAAHTLLDHAPDLTAVVALTDLLAEGVQAACTHRALTLPVALSIVGFDDIAPATAGLTTIHQPHRQKGRDAAELLLGRIERPDQAAEPALLPTSLIVRGSTTSASPDRLVVAGRASIDTLRPRRFAPDHS